MRHEDPRILLVDDTEAQRYALRRTLEAAGFTVQEAGNGLQALAFAAHQPDLILLDINLPDMDGFSVCRQLKADPATAHIPVIHMSACFVREQDKIAGLETGADDYLLQPISSGELLAKLKAWMRVRRAEAELRQRNLELQAAIETVRSSEQEFRSIFQLAGLGQAQADAQGRFLRVNQKFCDITGYSECELLHLSALDITHPDDRASSGEAYERMMRGETDLYRSEKRYLRKDGSIVWARVTATVTRNTAGRATGCVGMIEDITERKRTDEALRQDITHRERMERELTDAKQLVETRLAQFHATINSMTEGVCFFDAHGEALLVNQAFFRIYGFDRECLPESTRKLFMLSQAYDLKGNFVPQPEWPLYAALRGEVVRHRELRVRRTDTGREVILGHNAAPVRDSSGKVVMAVVTVEDISAIKQAEQALVRSEKLASVGRMAATVAHEINNPLAAVMNTLFLARSAPDLPPMVGHYLDMADSELQRIAHITRQALGFYREPAAPASTSVTSVMDSAVDLLKSKIKAKHASVERQYEEIPPVIAIAGELRQVFSNLLANSLDAITENGTVKLRISSLPRPDTGRGWVRVTVADNGKGIDSAALPHIFEPFFTTKESVGTGLGLWVSKQIMDKHGGSIRVHSRTNGRRRGTVFSLLLPAEVAVSFPLRAAIGSR